MPQVSLANWVQALDDSGLLRRYTDEKRVDELPQLEEENLDCAVLVEKVKDCAFPFFANGYQTREICALALGCDPKDVGKEIGNRNGRHHEPELVDTAPCKDVILKGDDVDLTIFPMFLHHDQDGQAYISDGRIITENAETGYINDAVQRMMFRTKNLVNIDERALNHAGSINAKSFHDLDEETPIAVCIGGPSLDQISSMMRVPGSGIDAWEKLGGYLGESAQIVRCETNDLTVPANAEIVLEGRILTNKDMVDEGPYGEAPGTYGPEPLGLNWQMQVDCITYRKDAIYQGASIGGLHPGRTDMYIWGLAVEGELYQTLRHVGIDVRQIYVPYPGSPNAICASIKTTSGGDAKQALGTMLTASRQQFPKMAWVFDEDIDIFDEGRRGWAETWRYNPGTDTLLIDGQNINPLDPSVTMLKPPYSITKIGFDCTMPMGPGGSRFLPATVAPPITQPDNVTELDEDELVKQLTDYIKQAPRSWKDILERFAGQPYPLLYRAFGHLRPQLGRVGDAPPYFPYTFSDQNIVTGNSSA